MQHSLPEMRLIGEAWRIVSLLDIYGGKGQRGSRGLQYDQRLYGTKKHKGLSFVLAVAISQRHIVVCDFTDVSFVYASGDGSNVYELAFVSAKQILGMLSFHC
jgi:hypothetical protein